LYNTPASLAQLNNYNTDFDRNLVQFPGCAFKQETIMFGNGANFSNETTFIFKDLNDFKATACIELMKKLQQTIGNCAPTVSKTCRSEQG
jgi:hypothetical protein